MKNCVECCVGTISERVPLPFEVSKRVQRVYPFLRIVTRRPEVFFQKGLDCFLFQNNQRNRLARKNVYEREGEREKERGGERNRRKFSLRCTATMCPPSENIQKRRTDKLSARRPTFEGQRETSRRYTVNTGSDDDVEPALLQEPVTPRFFLFSPSACFDLLVP